MSVADAPEGVRIRILGDTIAYAPDGSLLRLSRMQRIMLCRLALGGVVHISELADAVWGSDAPSTARASLQNQVGRLRALLGPEAIATCDDGYQLAVPTDADLGHELVLRAESAHAAGDAETVFDACTRALALIRGEPCADLMDVRDAVLPRRAIHTWIRIAEDLQVASALSLGRTSLALFRAEELYEREPLDEGRATLLARALAEAGRRGDALGIIDQVRENLRTELGLDLSGELVALRASLLEPAPSVAMAPSRFVGRETQLQRARQAVADDRSLVVTAEPGGGVSRFLRELTVELRQTAGTCAFIAVGADGWAPGLELREICEQLRVEVDDALGPFRGFLPALSAAQHPVVIVIDDADRLGPSSRVVVERAAAQAAVCAVLGVHEPMPFGGFEVLTLPSLSQEAVDLLVADRCGATDRSARRALHEDTQGNPELLVSLLMDARVHDWLAAPETHGTPMSTMLLDLVQKRVRQLSAPGRATLDVLAVAGPQLTLAGSPRLVGAAALQELDAAGLVDVSDGGVAVRWEALRRGIEASIPPGRRAEIHHTIAETVPDLPVTVLARHRRESAAIDPVAAVAALVEAARGVSRLGAHDDAVRWLQQALKAVRDHAASVSPEYDVEVSIELGNEMRLAGMPEHVDVLVDAVERAEHHAPRMWLRAAFALLQLGATTESGALHPAVQRITDRLEMSATSDEDSAVARAAASLAWSMTGDDTRSRTLFADAEAQARSSRARRAVLPFAYLALGHPRDADARHRLARELDALAREADDPVAVFEALHLHFSNALIRPDLQSRRAALTEMRAMIDRVGDVGRRWALQYQEATEAHLDGRDVDAERFAEQGLELFGTVSESRAFAAYASQLLALRITQGRVDELASVVAGLVADQPGVRAWEAVAALTVTRADPGRAIEHARQALRATETDFTWLAAHVVGGRAAALAGDPLLAAEYLRRLEPWSGLGAWQGNCSLGPVDTTLALLARATGDSVATDRFAARARETARDLDSTPHAEDLDTLGL